MARTDLIERIRKAEVKAYTIPTSTPESDGTLSWNKTVLVLVRLSAGNQFGIGYTYADRATAEFIRDELFEVVVGQAPFDIPKIERSMKEAIRNLGRSSVAAMAISAVDTALWDLKAKILGVSVLDLLGAVREKVPVYGSGGFTNFSDQQLAGQIEVWLKVGIAKFKIKIGRDQRRDLERIRKARQLIGLQRELFVDANGAYDMKQALEMASRFREFEVSWFEEPVPSENRAALSWIRDHLSPEIELAAGEYGYTLDDFNTLLKASCVDVLQADVTRCGGYSGFLRVATLARAWKIPLSSHCAPALHASLGCALSEVRHLEYFSDHARIEEKFFEKSVSLKEGALWPDRSQAGLGIEVKFSDLDKEAA